mgnify:CR=1 FL=1
MNECIITPYGKSCLENSNLVLKFNIKQNIIGYILIRLFEVIINNSYKYRYNTVENIDDIIPLISFS